MKLALKACHARSAHQSHSFFSGNVAMAMSAAQIACLHVTWRHAIWAAVIAIATFPLKKLWDWWADRAWQAFKASFMASFKKTEGGQVFLKSFYESRAARDKAAIESHPE